MGRPVPTDLGGISSQSVVSASHPYLLFLFEDLLADRFAAATVLDHVLSDWIRGCASRRRGPCGLLVALPGA